jgi:hypothetical protein
MKKPDYLYTKEGKKINPSDPLDNFCNSNYRERYGVKIGTVE